MKCYKEVWKLHNLKKNYGCFIISFIILFYFFSILIFCCCSFGKLTKEIKNIIFSLKYYESSKINKDKIYKQKKYFKNNNKENKIKKFNKAKKKQKKKATQKLITQSNSNKSYQIFKIKEINGIKLTKVNNKSNKKAFELKDFEMNSLNYEEALFMDKRGYFEYYCSLLKNNHPLFFSFITCNDYNSFIIKMFLFFYSFSLDFTINTLFFNDNTMHKIYEDKGEFNFLYQLPQIILSTSISKIINSIIKALSLTQDNIVQLKNIKNKT